jgi:arylsulfatase A-like enzyme
VIICFTDQQRWDTIGLHGNPLELTPNLDRAARRGTHLFNSFTPQHLCGPAQARLQTGLYATTTGCHINSIPLPQGTMTLAHLSREADYDTAYIGKWHLASAEPVPEAERGGYQYWLASKSSKQEADCAISRGSVTLC